MPRLLDTESWSRRKTFEYFKGHDNPYFNISARVDATALVAYCSGEGRPGVSITCHYFALRMVNEIEPFRYRLRDGKVVVHDVIHGGTTVLLPDESFTFAYFEYDRDFGRFAMRAQAAIADARSEGHLWTPRLEDDAMAHFTTVPWIAFTSFSHARNWRTEDSVPKIAFGKLTPESDRTWLPVSVEVHHALMDGLHVGRWMNGFERYLEDPPLYTA